MINIMKKLLAILAFIPTVAFAWQPTKPVTVIFPNGPGAGNEVSFRMVAAEVTRKTGVVFNAQHMGGADGNIAISHFAQQAPDGYTIAMPACQSTWVAAEIWYPQAAKFNVMEFVHVLNIGKAPLAFYAATRSKVNTPQDLIAEVRAGQRPLNFAVGGAAHKLAVEYFVDKVKPSKDTVETSLYKGPAQAMADVLGGHQEFGVFPIAIGGPMVKEGKLKLIGLAGEVNIAGFERAPLMKDYVPGLNVYACWNMVLPKGTPPEIAKWYREQFTEAMKMPELRAKYEKNFMFMTPSEWTEEGLRASVTALRNQWQPYVRKIKPE